MITARLHLVPIKPQDFLALIDGYDAFAASFGYPAAAGMRDFLVSGEVSPAWLAQLHASREPDPWKYGFAVVHPDEALFIGVIGFKGPPDDAGMVEIAYGIAESHQRRGYATEASTAVLKFAAGDSRVRVVRAHTKDFNVASSRVLQKLGFQCLGEVIDPEDGPVLRWERPSRS